MDDKDQVTDKDRTPTIQNQPRLSYNFLLRLSKRMGTIATKSFVDVKDFLNQEVTVSPTERFLAGMPKIRLQKNGEESSQIPKSDGETGDTENTIDPHATLNKIVKQSREILAEANTVFPITLFPDTVFVDRTKVTIIKRDFFWSSDTMSFRIEDILNVEVTVGPLFGSLIIASRVMSTTDHFQIKHFWRNDAIYLKRIIQGYVIAQHNKIEVAHLPKDELVRTLTELGHDQNV